MDREQARIKATQYQYIKAKYGNTKLPEKPLGFVTWFRQGARSYAKKGYKLFGFKSSKTYSIIHPDGRITIRSERSFRNEYETEYLVKFPRGSLLPFEEAAGI